MDSHHRQHGERLIITDAQCDVDPDSPVTIWFNKRMFVGAATNDTSVTTFPQDAHQR